MQVIGTAGHVDHGKSTLIEALTGIHPDRLKEEREREMTIDLGFAWLTLSNGAEVGIVDVPGHRDFIENMLAGIGGIDAVLFVIAADEGIMPQTREHLAILDLLHIQSGVIALTKIDLVDDSDWLDLVQEDVHQAVQGTVLAQAPIVRVSARSGQGMNELVAALEAILSDRQPRLDYGRPRLPVDRVFTLPGFGTIVTGTLSDGIFKVGDEVEVLPQGIRGRVRGLQTHKRKSDRAHPGSRTAINISGVNLDEIMRGNVIAHPGLYRPTRRIDVQFELLVDVSTPVKHNTQVKLFTGAAEVLGRVRLLGLDQLDPGEVGWLQLELVEPVAVFRGDRFILRRPSPSETLGGGVVVDAAPKGRYKRFSQPVLERLEALAGGSREDLVEQALLAGGIMSVKALAATVGLNTEIVVEALHTLQKQGRCLPLEDGDLQTNSELLVIDSTLFNKLINRVQEELERFHRQYPLRQGMPKEELKSRLKLGLRPFNALFRRLMAQRIFLERGNVVHLPVHELQFSDRQQKLVDGLLRLFKEAPYSPPGIKEATSMVGEDIFQALLDLGFLVQVSGDVVFLKEDYDTIRSEIIAYLEKKQTLTVAEMRDQYQTSRRYALALLEHLDATGVTVRDGDLRRLKPSKSSAG
jgi:selenocysteine-specific elongation factor